MSQRVEVRLTPMEAEALEAAANNVLWNEEDAYAVLLTKERVAAAYRAVKKLKKAISDETSASETR